MTRKENHDRIRKYYWKLITFVCSPIDHGRMEVFFRLKQQYLMWGNSLSDTQPAVLYERGAIKIAQAGERQRGGVYARTYVFAVSHKCHRWIRRSPGMNFHRRRISAVSSLPILAVSTNFRCFASSILPDYVLSRLRVCASACTQRYVCAHVRTASSRRM